MRYAERLAQHRNEFQRHRQMSEAAGTVADERIFHVLELAEGPAKERCDLPPRQVVHAMRREQPVELEDLIDRAPLLVQAANAEEAPNLR
jgi:hypothetical protein